MDISSENWLSELVMDDEEYNIFHQCQIDNSLDHDFTPQDMVATAMGGENLMIKQSFSSESYSATLSNETTNHTTNNSSFERPSKQLKANSWNKSGTTTYTDDQVIPRSSSSSSSQVLSFANSGSPPTNDSPQFSGNFDCPMKPEDGTVYNGKLNYHHQGLISKDCSSAAAYEKNKNNNIAPKASQGNKRVHATSNRTPSHAQDHIMAERRRREKLSQRFIALSAIVPGLKKMDKASVLGDAIKYLKQLQERVNLLEEQTKKRTVESVVFVNKSQLTASNSDEDTSSSDENPDVLSNEALPEIEARVSEKNVLIRIHCEKNKGVIAKVLSEVEMLQLTVVNSSALPFGNHAMDITVVAQMENDFCMTVKDLVKNLRLAFLKFM